MYCEIYPLLEGNTKEFNSNIPQDLPGNVNNTYTTHLDLKYLQSKNISKSKTQTIEIKPTFGGGAQHIFVVKFYCMIYIAYNYMMIQTDALPLPKLE